MRVQGVTTVKRMGVREQIKKDECGSKGRRSISKNVWKNKQNYRGTEM